MKLIKTNVNYYIHVKLTDIGRTELKRQHEQFIKDYPKMPDDLKEHKLPKEDKDGYSRFQLWSLMGIFGHMLQVQTFHLPFETNVKIEVDE